MPACPVQHHENELIRMALGHFGQEHAPGLRIHRRQDQGVPTAVVRTQRRKRLLVFPDHLGADLGPHPGRGPASSRIGDPSETRFVLKQHADRQALVRQSGLRHYLLLDQFG
jgi:hypothetical protein